MSSNNTPSSLADGRYRLGRLIGRGGMAEVREALDTRLGRTVAVKIMRSDLANDDIFLSRFRREAHSVAQMNNPNIVNIYDSGEETVVDENGQSERLPYLVMEYVKGQTLRDIIKANGPLSQRDAEQVMLGVLNALEYSHRMGIIHRDIKPGNIMISEQGVVKVMDFGIARALDDSVATMTQSQGVVGTAQYLSPEQARGETVDMRSDLYSAGCVLYEMLTGTPPFTGDSAVAIAYQHVSEVATPPSSVVPGLPRMWDQICAKAMAKDRQNRYATAAEFKNDVLAFMNGGVPVAAAFNPLTDLANMKARKQAEQDAATVAMGSAETTATQAFNPVTGQFESIQPMQSATGADLKTRTAQRELAAKRRRRRHITIGSVIAAIALILAVAGGLYYLHATGTPQKVTVPTFNSLTNEERAREQLAAVGLNIQVEQDTDSTEPKGTFTKQDPKGGAQVDEGSTVKVWFSVGPQSIDIPDVNGETQDAARQTLVQAGFKVATSTKTEDSDDVEKDHVTRTDPASGTAADKGSTILLYLSSGMTKVPTGLVDQPQDQVLTALAQRQFNTRVLQEYSDSVPKNSVTRVDPAEGTSIEQRATITVYVSQGKEQATVPLIDLSSGDTTYADVKTALEAAGFKVTTSDGSQPDDDDIVTAMDPTGGTEVDKGSTIKLTVQPAPSDDDTDTDTDDDPGDDNGNNGKAS